MVLIQQTSFTVVRCEYGTVFAIANPSEHLQPGDGYSFQRNSCNGGVVCGRDGRNYLFYHFRRPGPYDVPVEKLPRMSATEVEERWAEILPRRVSESADFTYADLLSAGTTSKGQSVLPHFTLPKWYNGRIMAMGDAVHKFNPMTAQGGNNCIETAAAIANHLHDTLARHNIPLLQPQWPQKAVEEIFAAVEQERFPACSANRPLQAEGQPLGGCVHTYAAERKPECTLLQQVFPCAPE